LEICNKKINKDSTTSNVLLHYLVKC